MSHQTYHCAQKTNKSTKQQGHQFDQKKGVSTTNKHNRTQLQKGYQSQTKCFEKKDCDLLF
jgi:hypothetical protein